jgi:hypothetical protein
MPVLPYALPQPFTKEGFNTLFADPNLPRTERALGVITNPEGTVDQLAALVAEGDTYDILVQRSPRHPRKAVVMKYLLDASYDKSEMFTSEPKIENGAAVFTIGGDRPMAPDWKRRVALFSWMAEKGFTPGENSWRGPLFKAVMNDAFYYPKTESAFAYAQAAVKTGRVNLAQWARNSYVWHGSMESLDVLKRLGQDISAPGLLDGAVHFLRCAINPKDPENGRAEVVAALIGAGARISRKALVEFQDPRGGGQHGLDYAKRHHIHDLICNAPIQAELSDLPAAAGLAPAAGMAPAK